MLSRSVSSYIPSSSNSARATLEGREHVPKPRASCPPVHLEAPSSLSIDEHATRLAASAEQLMQALELWSLNKKAVWQISAMFARLTNECSVSAAVFSAAGADISTLATVPAELRTVLEQLLTKDPSPSCLKRYTPSLDDIIQRFLSQLQAIRNSHGDSVKDQAPAPLPKLRSVNLSLESFVKSVAKLKESIDAWSVKEEAPDDDVRTSLHQLEESFLTLCASLADRGIDAKAELGPILDELKTTIDELVSTRVNPEAADPYEDRINAILIRLLSGLKAKQTQLAQARQEIKRRATFRMRGAIFEDSPSAGPRLPSTLARASTGRRNFTR